MSVCDCEDTWHREGEACDQDSAASDRPCAACGRLSPGDWCILPDCPGAA